MEHLIALVALSAMEIVLGIDNIVFIAILTSRLPQAQQAKARQMGLAVALLSRLALLMTLSIILKLTNPVLQLEWLDPLLTSWGVGEHTRIAIEQVSIRDLILLTGGLFLIWKSVREIHEKIEGDSHELGEKKQVSFGSVIAQIAVLDIIFSLDSVITAVGMVKSDAWGLWIMVAAVVIAVGVMLTFSGAISGFVERHPTLKVLALSFLILIGVMLVAEGIGTEINKGYIYFAMTFALAVECLNIRTRKAH